MNALCSYVASDHDHDHPQPLTSSQFSSTLTGEIGSESASVGFVGSLISKSDICVVDQSNPSPSSPGPIPIVSNVFSFTG